MKKNKKEDFDKLLEFIDFFKFDFISFKLDLDNNICAVLAEVVLQSGMNYKTVVKPRIDRIKDVYDDINTIESILEYINFSNVGEILQWKGDIKKSRFLRLVKFLSFQGVDNCYDLKQWLLSTNNQNELLTLDGIGPKSLDYIMLLVGISSIPIDRHLLSFAQMSGVDSSEYEYISSLYKEVSKYHGIEYHVLDSTIWNFMNEVLVS
jgi:endonuclease III-like uncharacterized protein